MATVRESDSKTVNVRESQERCTIGWAFLEIAMDESGKILFSFESPFERELDENNVNDLVEDYHATQMRRAENPICAYTDRSNIDNIPDFEGNRFTNTASLTKVVRFKDPSQVTIFAGKHRVHSVPAYQKKYPEDFKEGEVPGWYVYVFDKELLLADPDGEGVIWALGTNAMNVHKPSSPRELWHVCIQKMEAVNGSQKEKEEFCAREFGKERGWRRVFVDENWRKVVNDIFNLPVWRVISKLDDFVTAFDSHASEVLLATLEFNFVLMSEKTQRLTFGDHQTGGVKHYPAIVDEPFFGAMTAAYIDYVSLGPSSKVLPRQDLGKLAAVADASLYTKKNQQYRACVRARLEKLYTRSAAEPELPPTLPSQAVATQAKPSSLLPDEHYVFGPLWVDVVDAFLTEHPWLVILTPQTLPLECMRWAQFNPVLAEVASWFCPIYKSHGPGSSKTFQGAGSRVHSAFVHIARALPPHQRMQTTFQLLNPNERMNRLIRIRDALAEVHKRTKAEQAERSSEAAIKTEVDEFHLYVKWHWSKQTKGNPPKMPVKWNAYLPMFEAARAAYNPWLGEKNKQSTRIWDWVMAVLQGRHRAEVYRPMLLKERYTFQLRKMLGHIKDGTTHWADGLDIPEELDPDDELEIQPSTTVDAQKPVGKKSAKSAADNRGDEEREEGAEGQGEAKAKRRRPKIKLDEESQRVLEEMKRAYHDVVRNTWVSAVPEIDAVDQDDVAEDISEVVAWYLAQSLRRKADAQKAAKKRGKGKRGDISKGVRQVPGSPEEARNEDEEEAEEPRRPVPLVRKATKGKRRDRSHSMPPATPVNRDDEAGSGENDSHKEDDQEEADEPILQVPDTVAACNNLCAGRDVVRIWTSRPNPVADPQAVGAAFLKQFQPIFNKLTRFHALVDRNDTYLLSDRVLEIMQDYEAEAGLWTNPAAWPSQGPESSMDRPTQEGFRTPSPDLGAGTQSQEYPEPTLDTQDRHALDVAEQKAKESDEGESEKESDDEMPPEPPRRRVPTRGSSKGKKRATTSDEDEEEELAPKKRKKRVTISDDEEGSQDERPPKKPKPIVKKPSNAPPKAPAGSKRDTSKAQPKKAKATDGAKSTTAKRGAAPADENLDDDDDPLSAGPVPFDF